MGAERMFMHLKGSGRGRLPGTSSQPHPLLGLPWRRQDIAQGALGKPVAGLHCQGWRGHTALNLAPVGSQRNNVSKEKETCEWVVTSLPPYYALGLGC